MTSELDEVTARAKDLAVLANERPEGERAKQLLDRLETGLFLVAVVGEFKRGKSTLINALLGDQVVPSGVLPLTAVATNLRYGDSAAVVELLDGTRSVIEPTRVAEFVTETANPGNERGVERVEIHGRWPILEPGVVLVDTPGIGSIFRHNTEVGRAALVDADGAIMVLSADAPLSEQERDLLGVLAERRSPTFFVLNKSDHLTSDELIEVRKFVGLMLCQLLGHEVPLFAVNARDALAARRVRGGRAGEHGLEFDAFAKVFKQFIVMDLAGARAATARAELHRLGMSLRDAITVEEAAAKADAAELALLVEQFAGEAARQRRAFEDDRTLLARDVNQLVDDVGRRLAAFARAAPAEHAASLAEIASAAPRDRLVDELRIAVETVVRSSFETFRQSDVARVEEAWQEIAESFRTRTQHRVDEARLVAARLFDVPLPHLCIPVMSNHSERFSYLFIHVGSTTEPISIALSRLVPSRLARRQALARAQAELGAEFDKHAGRARWDLSQRLEAVRRDSEQAMRAELDQSIEAIAVAAARAQEWHRSADDERDRWAVRVQRLKRMATELIALDQTQS
jgi:GTP-binding protein EngB required for normal cell division